MSPVIAALVGAGLIGAGADLAWSTAAGLAAAVLELLRGRLLPRARVHTGLLAYAAVLLASQGAPAAYLHPLSTRPEMEPIRLWLNFFEPSSAPVNAVMLYVGNVPGPIIATSLLAVAISVAWLWYADRLAIGVLLGFGVGALVPISVMHWNPVFQLASGPLWFVAGLILAEKRFLPAARHLAPLLGFAAAVAAVAPRARGYSIEAALVAGAGVQLAIAATEGGVWLLIERQKVAETFRRIWGKSAALRFNRSKASGA
jgi:hypothetical protein